MEKVVKRTRKKPDRRIAKTKRAITTAFVELMLKHEVKDIKIKEIADVADVNRKTVYNYYDSVYEILDDIEANIISQYELVLKDLDFSCNYKNIYKVFYTLSKVINNDAEFYSKLLKMNNNVGLIVKLINYLRQRIGQTLLDQNIFIDPRNVSIATTFIVSGMISTYKQWFASGQVQSLEELSKDVSRLVTGALSSFVK